MSEKQRNKEPFTETVAGQEEFSDLEKLVEDMQGEEFMIHVPLGGEADARAEV